MIVKNSQHPVTGFCEFSLGSDRDISAGTHPFFQERHPPQNCSKQPTNSIKMHLKVAYLRRMSLPIQLSQQVLKS